MSVFMSSTECFPQIPVKVEPVHHLTQTILTSNFLEPVQSSIASISLLGAIATLPSSPLSRTVSTRIHLATMLLASLLRSSPPAKSLVRGVVPTLLPQHPMTPAPNASFFVPADGPAAGEEPVVEKTDDEEDRPQTLLQTIAEHLSLAFLSRSKSIERGDGREEREWDRLIIGYLSLLSQWLWENPVGVREFLEAGGLSVVSPNTYSFSYHHTDFYDIS